MALELLRDATGRREAVCRATREHHGVQRLDGFLGAEKVCLARCRSTAAHVDGAQRARGAEYHRAARPRRRIGRLSDHHALDVQQRYLPHHAPSRL